MHSSELFFCLQLGLIYGIVALGLYLTFRIIRYTDLTCDGSFVCGGAVFAVLSQMNLPIELALIGATITGSLAGALTATLSTFGKINAPLPGILVAFMLYSINLKIMGGSPNLVLQMPALTLPFLVGIAALVYLGTSYLLSTDFGLAMRACGQNKSLSLQGGIHIRRMTIFVLMLSNGLIALGGALFTWLIGFVDLSQGFGTVICALAAIMIGQIFAPSKGIWISCFALFIGSILYRLVIAFALHADFIGVQSQDGNLITGLLILLITQVRKEKLCYS